MDFTTQPMAIPNIGLSQVGYYFGSFSVISILMDYDLLSLV
jgi:hypothetical protein